MTMKRYLSLLLVLMFSVMSINGQSSLQPQIQELARELNLWRLNQGLGPLLYNPILERMAAVQADYVLSLPSLPDDLHAGAQGENPRIRSQFEEFSWPTYGHPEIISVTEITAIGSIASAINFWRNSDIHNRSVTNPAFREMGIAARQYGTDIMYVVVLGGQPDVLPALLDNSTDPSTLYLTTELAQWDGVWIDEVSEYRFLDVENQPLTDWAEWEFDIEVEDELLAELPLIIEYRDVDDKRTQYEVASPPVWSNLPVPEAVAIVPTETLAPTEAPDAENEDADAEDEGGIFTANTAVPTPTITPSPMPTRTPFPTFTPTMTPLPRSITFFYNANVFSLYNSGSGFADLSALTFEGADANFTATFWEEVASGLNISALPAGQCVIIEPESENEFMAASQCAMVRSVVEEPNPRYFWLSDFDILIDGEVIATCSGDADSCQLTLD